MCAAVKDHLLLNNETNVQEVYSALYLGQQGNSFSTSEHCLSGEIWWREHHNLARPLFIIKGKINSLIYPQYPTQRLFT